MVGGPALGDQQAQEGGYNASLQNRAEAAARGDSVQPDASSLMVVGPLMSSVALRQVRDYALATAYRPSINLCYPAFRCCVEGDRVGCAYMQFTDELTSHNFEFHRTASQI